MHALNEKHLVMFEIIIFGVFIFWLIASDPRSAVGIGQPQPVATPPTQDLPLSDGVV